MDYVTLLLVDDDAELLRMLQRRLELDGYDVMTAEGGRPALAALDRKSPDLAVIDLMMPGMDGFELAEQIKRRGDLPIIFLTSVGDTKTRIEAIRQFAEDYVLKPFDYEELIARVQRILRRTAGSSPVSEPLVVVDAGLTLDFSRAEAHGQLASSSYQSPKPSCCTTWFTTLGRPSRSGRWLPRSGATRTRQGQRRSAWRSIASGAK